MSSELERRIERLAALIEPEKPGLEPEEPWMVEAAVDDIGEYHEAVLKRPIDEDALLQAYVTGGLEEVARAFDGGMAQLLERRIRCRRLPYTGFANFLRLVDENI